MFSRYLLEKRHRIFQAKRKKSKLLISKPQQRLSTSTWSRSARLILRLLLLFPATVFFCQRVLEILRISTTDQTNPLEFDQHKNCNLFFSPRFFNIQISQPGSKAGQFCSGRFFGRFFFLSFMIQPPWLFQPLRCQCSEFFHQNITTNITKTGTNGTIDHPPKNQFRVC